MTMTKILLPLLVFMASNSVAAGSDDYSESLKTWRVEKEASLKSEGGWLSVIGLHWLKNGESSVGSSDRATIVLPEKVPLKLGRLSHLNGKTSIQFDTITGVLLDGQTVKTGLSYDLKTDGDQKASEISVGTVKFFLIKRPNGIGVRVKDSESFARKNFKGRKWFAPAKKFIFKSKWTALTKPVKLMVPDVLGNSLSEDSPGFATFEYEGKKHTLHPTKDGDELFFVFNDKTSGKETYGAGRFLYASAPVDGEVILDFNKAVNPPSAFTNFATCPLPPKENRLQVAIEAGELKPDDH
jgi:uncharacterized protein